MNPAINNNLRQYLEAIQTYLTTTTFSTLP